MEWLIFFIFVFFLYRFIATLNLQRKVKNNESRLDKLEKQVQELTTLVKKSEQMTGKEEEISEITIKETKPAQSTSPLDHIKEQPEPDQQLPINESIAEIKELLEKEKQQNKVSQLKAAPLQSKLTDPESDQVLKKTSPEKTKKSAQSSWLNKISILKKQAAFQESSPVLMESKRKNSTATSQLWFKLRQKFFEYWMGIIGAILLVMGLSFLGIFYFSPMLRFFLLTGVSIVLVILSFILKKQPVWLQLALLLRSAAGAVFLFACLGAGGIPGLKWIDHLLLALLLLCAGIGVNLFLAWFGGKQSFASLHVLLSLISIAIAPQNEITFTIAGVITFFGILLTLRERWDLHLFLTIISFFCFLIFVRFQLRNQLLIQQRILIISIIIINFSTALLMHYRKLYQTTIFEVKPFLVHLACWAFMGLGILLYAAPFSWISIPILAASLIVFFIARFARKLNIRWLYLTDTMIAETIALIGLMSLFYWKVPVFPILLVIFWQILIFSLIMHLEKENRLFKVGLVLKYSMLPIILVCAFLFSDQEMILLYQHGLLLFITTLFTVLFQKYLSRNTANQNENSSGFLNWKIKPIIFVLSLLMIICITAIIGNQLWNFSIDWGNYILFISLFSLFYLLRPGMYFKSITQFEIYLQVLTWIGATLLLLLGVPFYLMILILFYTSLVFAIKYHQLQSRALLSGQYFIQGLLIILITAFSLTGIDPGHFTGFLIRSIQLGIALFAYLGYQLFLNKRMIKPSTSLLPITPTSKNKLLIISFVFPVFILLASIILYFNHSLTSRFVHPELLLFLSLLFLILFQIDYKNNTINLIFKLINQLIFYIVILAALNFEYSFWLISILIFLGTLIFMVKYLIFRQYNLYFMNNFILFISSLFLISITLFQPGKSGNLLYFKAVLIFISAVLMIIVTYWGYRKLHLNHQKKFQNNQASLFNISEPFSFNLISFLFPFFILAIHIILLNKLPWVDYINAEYLVFFPFIALLIYRQRTQIMGLTIGLLVSLLLFFITSWLNLYQASTLVNYSWQKLVYAIPLFVTAFTSIKVCYFKPKNIHFKAFGIYLFYLHCGILTYLVFKPLTPLATGIVWLILSLIVLEISFYLKKKHGTHLLEMGSPDHHLILTGYAFILAFLIRHILVHLQSQAYIGIVRIRLLIEIFALFVLIYWFFYQRKELATRVKGFQFIQSYFLELIILFSILSIVVETKSVYHPLIWIGMSIGFLFLGNLSWQKISRLQFYSLLFFWISVFHVVFIASPIATSKFQSFTLDWILAMLSIIGQFIYIVLFFRLLKVQDITFPNGLTFFKKMISLVDKRRGLWVFYPLFVAIFFFFTWSFDKGVLTFLYCLEVFMIFICSIILVENQFLYIAYIGLLSCLVRLIGFDLRNEDLFIRALVFIGVSIPILVMNAIFNKFKGRFKKDETTD
ncbi:MAG: hypothetical protein MJB14_01300 [Spirochaetes bacterium]|nr:hypothetical protein [Spirochaetota bacterium]